MSDKIKYQAHRGVSTECPENTMPALIRAVYQNYDIAEIDVSVTRDGQFVLLHDSSINRTARKPDGSAIEEKINICDIDYADALNYDFGLSFSVKFKGTPIPKFSDVLEFAKENGIVLKLDNKYEKFTDEQKEAFYRIIEPYAHNLALTCSTLENAVLMGKKFPTSEIHYDGAVNTKLLKQLHSAIPKTRLTVWLKYPAQAEVVNCTYANELLCDEVKHYASLGIWKISENAEFRNCAYTFGADVIETNGKVKPVRIEKGFFDCHSHSQNSHDSQTPVADNHASALKKQLAGFCVTDHCDVEYAERENFGQNIYESYREARAEGKTAEATPCRIFAGVEMGEAIRYPDVANKIIEDNAFDQITGSVHAARYPGFDLPFGLYGFTDFSEDEINKYIETYFTDMLETVKTQNIDTLAHLGSAVRLISGRIGKPISIMKYKPLVEQILKEIIKRGIALEMNTSGAGEDAKGFLPGEDVLSFYRSLGGYLVVMGSDAHVSPNIGQHFDKMRLILLQHGFENAYYFVKRNAVQYSLYEGLECL